MRSLRKNAIKTTVVKKPLFDTTVKLPKKEKTKRDIKGPNNEGTFLLEQAIVLAKFFDIDHISLEKEMKAKDFKHLVKVFDKHFKDYVQYTLN
jgi:hypothetical protein